MSTGFYMPSDHRQKLAQEVTKTHFALGNAGRQEATSYQSAFKPSIGAVELRQLQKVSPSLELSAQHPPTKCSEFKARFQSSDTPEKPPQPIKRSPRNLELGTESAPFSPTSKRCHAGGSAAARAAPLLDAASLRSHHFQLGSDRTRQAHPDEESGLPHARALRQGGGADGSGKLRRRP